MGKIAENIASMRQQLPGNVTLVAVSKFHPLEELEEAYATGQTTFGENRAQELEEKAKQMPRDVKWHFIGHLQTNKVRGIMPHVSMIQSIDSVKLLQLVGKEAMRIGRTVDVLLQLHVALEETKSGFTPQEIIEAADNGLLNGVDGVRICGVMTMATNTDDAGQVAKEFDLTRATFEQLRDRAFAGQEQFAHLSMGMSHDWRIAVDHGATIVRIGTSIFGPRRY